MDMATGGQDEAIFNTNYVSVSTFNNRVSTVCLLALPNGDSISRVYLLDLMDNKAVTDTRNIEITRISQDKRKASGFLAQFKLDGNRKVVVIMSNHFVGTPEQASLVQATFGYEGRNKIVTFQLDANIFFRTNKELDYTFVGIRDEDVSTLSKEHNVIPIKLEKEELRVQVGEVIHIPQHMEGKPKRISFSKVCGVTDTEVFYEADTSSGSSGSPVLYRQNEDMHPLALHKSGGVTMNNGIRANKGMLMSAILSHLRQHSGHEERTEGASSDGKKESGVFVGNTATTQGLPVVQTQSEESVPSTNSDAPSSSLVQETESPSLSSSHSQSSKSPMSLVEPPQGPPPVNYSAQVLCPHPFECRELVRIAKRISDKWRIIAKNTGYFKDYEITNITGDSSLNTTVLLADRMLNDFKSRLGKRKDLADAIDEAGLNDVAEKVRSGFYIHNRDD